MITTEITIPCLENAIDRIVFTTFNDGIVTIEILENPGIIATVDIKLSDLKEAVLKL